MAPSDATRTRSPKGEREAARILAAATTVLAREGIGGATLGRIAAEAGVDKRMLVYYFGGRDPLLAEVVREVGDRLIEAIRASLVVTDRLETLAEAVLERIWARTTQDPRLVQAYFALASGAGEDDAPTRALRALKERFERVFGDYIALLEDHGHRLRVDRDGHVTLVIALWRGLSLEWLEQGDTPALRTALAEFRQVAAAPFAPPD